MKGLTETEHSQLIDNQLTNDIRKRAALSHWIRTQHELLTGEPSDDQGWRKDVVLNQELIESIIKNPGPSIPGQADNYVRWLGDSGKAGGDRIKRDMLAIEAIIGSATDAEFLLVFNYLKNQGIIIGERQFDKIEKTTGIEAALTFPGIQRYDELKRMTSESRKAFMAMQYGEEELDRIVEDIFRPAVEETGFDLSRLDDPGQPAGLIDDRLRVAIRTSRFLIADLTHENRGAYWEAGYAEGLGKPVIYTCEEKKFEELQTHFDTNHHLTIKWDARDLDHAAQELKATIRATLPAEAKMTDD